MKKTFSVFIIVLYIVVVLATVYHLYTQNSSSPNNINLTNINSAIQIGYNLIYLTIATIVLSIANSQLNKTREATTIQTLSNIDSLLRSDDFLKKRKKLANLVCENGIDKLTKWLTQIKSLPTISTNDSQQIALIKNIFEDVIYQFEFIGYYHSKKIFSIEDVYQLFSIEIQQYWLLMEKLCFIEYLRNNKHNPIPDYYDKFEDLFKSTIKQEIKNKMSSFERIFLIFYSCGYYNYQQITSIEQKRKVIDQFLFEERNLI